MKAFRILGVSGLVMLAVTACADLEVVNLNDPDRERALATAGDVESLISGSFRTYSQREQSYTNANPLIVAADVGTASWGNFGMMDISSEPRAALNNSPSYGYSSMIESVYGSMYSALAAVRDGIIAIDGGLEIGDNGEDNARAMFFAKFIQGIAHGVIGMMYDQGFVLTEDTDIETATLSPYSDVIDQAVASLEEAIALAQANTFTIPANWMTLTRSNTEMVPLCHSFIARIMASAARTPAERAAVNWSTVASHASQGITEDFIIVSDDVNWWSSHKVYTMQTTWMRVDYKLIGQADNSGGYQNWINTPVQQRTEFIMAGVEDMRISSTGGVGEAVDSGTYFGKFGLSSFKPERGTYHYSRYVMHRFTDQYDWIGPFAAMTPEEMNLLRAEAAYRQGDLQGAADLINISRVGNGGLPPVTTTGVTEIGGLCTPRTDSGQCGDLFDALMYEKLLEGFAVANGIPLYDKRGWGTLLTGTPIHLPVPGEELLVMLLDIYTFGGGGEGSAPDEIINFDFNDPEAVQERIEAYDAYNNAEMSPHLFQTLR